MVNSASSQICTVRVSEVTVISHWCHNPLVNDLTVQPGHPSPSISDFSVICLCIGNIFGKIKNCTFTISTTIHLLWTVYTFWNLERHFFYCSDSDAIQIGGNLYVGLASYTKCSQQVTCSHFPFQPDLTGGWTRWPPDIPTKPYNSVILWFCKLTFEFL